MKAFLTGSQAYGTPRADSDIDLVVLVDVPTLIALESLGAVEDDKKVAASDIAKDDGLSASIRFGSLNLILVTTKKQYDAWVEGTIELKARRPVTRDEAVATFKKVRGRLGLL